MRLPFRHPGKKYIAPSILLLPVVKTTTGSISPSRCYVLFYQEKRRKNRLNGNFITDFVESFRADAFDVDQVVNFNERLVLSAVIDDRLSFGWADTAQSFERRQIGRVNINDACAHWFGR